ncbi:MAG: hypothetical protein QOF86_3770, partial [Baekduia sp.]|nr:hypothetical protein [Baekduia sp.]
MSQSDGLSRLRAVMTDPDATTAALYTELRPLV